MSDELELEIRARARIGTVVRGKYRLDAILGMGGMAVVYKATHRNKAEFAIKMLHPDLCARTSIRTRFLREGYAANSVKHPGAVRVVDDDVAEDGAAFLVMELLDGVSVDRILDPPAAPPSVRVACAIALQLLDVLAAAHASGIVHRDIKPGNLFATRDGTVKVLDFGIARALDDTGGGGHLTGAGVPMGTPSFMAPEQALGRSSEIDARTDVWAAGATLFTLLSGKPVHEGSATAEILVAAATVPVRSLASAVPDLDAGIARVVDRALAFDRAERWGNAGEMREALAAACTAAGVESPDKSAIAALFTVALVTQHSNHPAAFAPTAESLPSLPGSGASREATAPAVASTGRRGSGPAGPRRVSPLYVGLVLGAAVLGVAAVTTWRARSAAPLPAAATAPVGMGSAPAASNSAGAAAPRRQVLVVAIDNQAGDPLFDGTVDFVLGSAIRRSPSIGSYAAAPLRALASELDAGASPSGEDIAQKLLARDGGQVVVVRGAVTLKGGGYTLSITAKDARTGAVVLSGSRDAADAAGVVPAIGRLACDLRAALGETPPSDPHEAEQTGMSGSIEADHEAIIGSALVNQGKYDEAIVYLRRVVSADPSWGKGHWVLANVLSNAGDHAGARREYEAALQNAGAMGEIDRLQLQAGYYEAIGSHDRAIEPLQQVLLKDPGNLHVETALTGELIETNQIDRAVQMAEQTTVDHPGEVIAWNNLAEVQVRASNADGAAAAAQKVLGEFPHPLVHAYVFLALAEALRAHPAQAADAYGKLAPRNGSLATHGLADLALADGRLADADKLLRDGIDADVAAKRAGAAASKQAMLAEELVRGGDRPGAVAAARKAAAQSQDAATLYVAGEAELEAGDAKDALAIADALGKNVPALDRMIGKVLEADTLRKRGKAKEALAKLGEARDIRDAWLVHLATARAQLDVGDGVAAEKEVRLCMARRGEGALAFDSDAPSFRVLAPLQDHLARALALQGHGK